MHTTSRTKLIWLLVVGMVLGVAALGAIAANAVSANEASGSSASGADHDEIEVAHPVTPCKRFLDAVLSDEPIEDIALGFGLTSDVPVPTGTETGKRHCLYRQAEGTEGTVLGVGIEDRDGDNVWVILSDDGLKLDDITEQDWRESLSTEGFTDLRRTPYGFTTVDEGDTGPIANLWSVLASDLRAASDE